MSRYLENVGFEELREIGLLRGYVTYDDIDFFMPRFTSDTRKKKVSEKLAALGIEIKKDEETLHQLARRIQGEKHSTFEEALFEANGIEGDIELRKRAFRKNYYVVGFILSRYGCVALIILLMLTISVPLAVFFMLMSGPAGP